MLWPTALMWWGYNILSFRLYINCLGCTVGLDVLYISYPYWWGLENSSSSSRIKSTEWHLKITAKECSQCWCLVCLQLQLRAERPYKAAEKGGCSRKLWLSGHFAVFLKSSLDFWFQCKNTCWPYSFPRNCTRVWNTPKLQATQGKSVFPLPHVLFWNLRDFVSGFAKEQSTSTTHRELGHK